MSDFRTRFGAQLTGASTELARQDFRARLGASLTLAARGLVAAPQGADFRERYGVALEGAAGELAAHRRARPRRRARRAPSRPRVSLPRVHRPIALGFALVATAGAATAATVWLPQIGSGGSGAGISASAPPPAELDALGVLRRASTPADQGALSASALRFVNEFTIGVRTNYVRLLPGTAHDFVLVPVVERLAKSGAVLPSGAQVLHDALCLYAADSATLPGGIQVYCYTLADVRAGHAINAFDNTLFGLAPDGVSTVTISFIGGVSLSAPVRDNFFEVAAPTSVVTLGPPSVSFVSGG